MSELKDLTGKKFGRLSVLNRSEKTRKSGSVYWNCICECGSIVSVCGWSLRSGNTRSCGCLQREIAIEASQRHGKSKTRLYRIYWHMKDRCLNPNDKRYPSYGGRGICICDEWKDNFEAFYDWSMSNGYTDNLSIDRIDNDGWYSPENCRWATLVQQCNNRRTNRFLTFNGETHTVSEWADIVGMQKGTLTRRVCKGWSTERALTQPVRRR